MAMSALIKSLEDIMRKDAGLNGDAQYIEQITWLLFLKAFDAKEMEWEFRPDCHGVIPEGLRWRDWAADKEGITGDALIAFVDKLFTKLKRLDTSDGDMRKFVVRNVFEDINNYMKSGVYLRQLINRINEKVDFIDATQKHTFNDLYEGMLKDLQSAGRAGEFYTPRPVTNFIVEMVNPKLGETVLDPACGTGGFLTSTIAHLGSVTTTEELEKLQTSINGWEKKPLPYLLAMTNLILHDIEVPRIRHQNSLNRPLSDYSAKDRVDVIVTNPPFGGAEDAAVKQNFPGEFQTSETADLFMALIMNLLKDRGRCGVVLPDGFMFGDGVKATIKEKLLKEYGLHTIIRLPQVFKPYASVNTNLLFFQKGVTSRGVWFYRLDYPEGVKSFTKTKPMQDKHFDPVREWWADKQPIVVDGFDKARFYTAEELRDLNYDFDKCCPFPHVEEEILEPNDLITRYQVERTELEKALDGLMLKVVGILNREEPVESPMQKSISSRLATLQKEFPDNLRKSVLQQAIHGKLTERDPSDEPASVLLKRINAKKERLIRDGKIRKEKPAPSITEEEIPFEIPDEWEWIHLNQVASSSLGKTMDKAKNSGVECPYLCSINVYWDGISLSNVKTALFTEEEREKYLLQKGDLLICEGGDVGRTAVWDADIEMYYQNALHRVRFYEGVNPYYFRYLMEYLKANGTIERFSKGQAIKHLVQSALFSIWLPLPPLAEQQRIVDRVNELLAVCDELK